MISLKITTLISKVLINSIQGIEPAHLHQNSFTVCLWDIFIVSMLVKDSQTFEVRTSSLLFWALRMMLFMDTSYKRKSTAHSCTPDGHWLSKPRGVFSRSLGKRSVDCSFFLNFYFTFEGVFKEAKLRELCTLYVNSIFINLGITNCPRSPIVRVSFKKKIHQRR